MFHLLLVNFSKVTSEKVQNICSQSADFMLYESNSLEKAISFCKQIKIHCVLLMPDADFIYAKRFMTFLRKFPTCIHTPVILLSTQIAHILQVIPQWNFIEIFMLPLSPEKEQELAHLVNYYHLLFRQTKDFSSRLCQISTSKGIYSFPYEEILFVEIVMKKAFSSADKGSGVHHAPLQNPGNHAVLLHGTDPSFLHCEFKQYFLFGQNQKPMGTFFFQQ